MTVRGTQLVEAAFKSQQSFLHSAALHKSMSPSKLVASWEYIVSSAELVT